MSCPRGNLKFYILGPRVGTLARQGLDLINIRILTQDPNLRVKEQSHSPVKARV